MYNVQLTSSKALILWNPTPTAANAAALALVPVGQTPSPSSGGNDSLHPWPTGCRATLAQPFQGMMLILRLGQFRLVELDSSGHLYIEPQNQHHALEGLGQRCPAPRGPRVPALEGLPGSAAGAACPAGLHSVLGSAFWGSPLSHVPLFGKALWRCVRQLQMAGPRFLMLPLSYGLLSSAIHRVIMRVAGVRIHPYRE